MHYYNSEPFGEWRADARSAQVAAIIANANRDTKRHPQPFKIEDFMLFKTKVADEKNVEEKPKSVDSEGAKIDPMLVAWLFRKSRAKMEA